MDNELMNELAEQAVQLGIINNSGSKSIWKSKKVDQLLKIIRPEITAKWKEKSKSGITHNIMRAARYGNYTTLVKLLEDESIPTEPVDGKTILHMVLDGMIAFKHKDEPIKIYNKNIIAGKEVYHSIIDSYFPPPNYCLYEGENPNHYDCLEYILKYAPSNLDINFTDHSGNAVIHYAVEWEETNAIEALLQAGAYVCNSNKEGKIPLKLIDSSTLEKYLDSCISCSDHSMAHPNFKIIFDYTSKSFIPSMNHVQDMGSDASEVRYEDIHTRESEFIIIMSEVPRFKKLLVHPVIRSYLMMKDDRIRRYLIFDLIYFTIYFILMIRSTPNVSDRILPIHLVSVIYHSMGLHKAYVLSYKNWESLKTLENAVKICSLALTFVRIVFKNTSLFTYAFFFLSFIEFYILRNRYPDPDVNRPDKTFLKYTEADNAGLVLLWHSFLLLGAYLLYTMPDESRKILQEDRDYLLNWIKDRGVDPWAMFSAVIPVISIIKSLPFGGGWIFNNILQYIQRLTKQDKSNEILAQIKSVIYIETMAVRDPIQLSNRLDKCIHFYSRYLFWSQNSGTQGSPVNMREKISVTRLLKNGKMKAFPNQSDSEVIQDAMNILELRRERERARI